MLVSMADELCWINVECVCVCVCVCIQRGQTLIHVPWAIKQLPPVPCRIHHMVLQPITSGRTEAIECVSYIVLFSLLVRSCLIVSQEEEWLMQLREEVILIWSVCCCTSEQKESSALRLHRLFRSESCSKSLKVKLLSCIQSSEVCICG